VVAAGADAVVLFLKNLVFTVLVPGTVAGLLPWQIAGPAAPSPGPHRILALVLFALGGGIYSWCVWDFAAYGRGTPAPIDAPKRLVVRGLYRSTRNPMYLGVLTVVTAWAVWFSSAALVVYAGIVAAAFHSFVVLYEEPHLEREFGSAYLSYKAEVARWLPGRPRRPAA